MIMGTFLKLSFLEELGINDRLLKEGPWGDVSQMGKVILNKTSQSFSLTGCVSPIFSLLKWRLIFEFIHHKLIGITGRVVTVCAFCRREFSGTTFVCPELHADPPTTCHPDYLLRNRMNARQRLFGRLHADYRRSGMYRLDQRGTWVVGGSNFSGPLLCAGRVGLRSVTMTGIFWHTTLRQLGMEIKAFRSIIESKIYPLVRSSEEALSVCQNWHR